MLYNVIRPAEGELSDDDDEEDEYKAINARIKSEIEN